MLDSPIADHEELSRRVHGARVRRAVLLEDHDKGEVTALIGHTTGADTADNQAVHQIEEDRLASGSVDQAARSEEHTSELQSLMRISYAVFCLKNITTIILTTTTLKIFTL